MPDPPMLPEHGYARLKTVLALIPVSKGTIYKRNQGRAVSRPHPHRAERQRVGSPYDQKHLTDLARERNANTPWLTKPVREFARILSS